LAGFQDPSPACRARSQYAVNSVADGRGWCIAAGDTLSARDHSGWRSCRSLWLGHYQYGAAPRGDETGNEARPSAPHCRGPGGLSNLTPFGCPEPFPFYVARIDDRLLLRPTPEGVRLDRNFCKIRFRFVRLWWQIEFCKIFRRADRSRSVVSSCAIGNGPEQPKETIPWPPRSQP
jgi:hypothetical protein